MQRSDMAKRTLDLAVVIPLILVCMPVWLLVAILIKLETPGSVLFRQTRVGRDGKTFNMYKFRSMVADAEDRRKDLESLNEMEGGVLFKMRRDPRITHVGHVLRRASIDETPQFLNVLTGEMSLVGPRPPLPDEVERYNAEQRRRLETKPGLTCLWQVSGRSLLSFDKQVHLDTVYIEQRSLWLDLVILLKTIPAVLGGRGAF
jgi:lipopolysaccharide/colanic/teichoic acid biosynthesis glycosyltransferase